MDTRSRYVDENQIYEEAGQKYSGKFWQEAQDSNFFKCIDDYNGGIHLVYGEFDRYISQELRNQVIDRIKAKGQQFEVLPNQDHSPWEYELTQNVYQRELEFLKRYFD